MFSHHYFTLSNIYNNFWGPLPSTRGDNKAFRYVKTPEGNMLIGQENSSHIYTISPSFIVNFESVEDNRCLSIGTEVGYFSLAAKYETITKKYWFKENHTVPFIGFPITIKIGGFSDEDDYDEYFFDDDFFDSYFYFYAGFQVNYNFLMYRKQSIEWTDFTYLTRRSGQEFKQFQTMYFFGYSHGHLKIQLNCYPKTFLDRDFTDENGIKPYYNQKNKLFYLIFGFETPFWF